MDDLARLLTEIDTDTIYLTRQADGKMWTGHVRLPDKTYRTAKRANILDALRDALVEDDLGDLI